MSRVSITATIDAPLELVFAYVDDYKNTTKYMKDLTKWSPVGKVTQGKGAQFNVAMQAGPTQLESVVDITTWKQNAAIGFTSVSGLTQSGAWTFKKGARGTEAVFTMEYELPGGIAGRWLSRAAEPIVRRNIQASVEALKAQTEKLHAKAAKPPAATPAKPKPSAASAAKSTIKPKATSTSTSTAAKPAPTKAPAAKSATAKKPASAKRTSAPKAPAPRK